MKTIIYTLTVFALIASPASCSKGNLIFQNNAHNSSGNSLASKDLDGDGIDDDTVLVIDPTKPIPKP
jgi:stress response protein SCP2